MNNIYFSKGLIYNNSVCNAICGNIILGLEFSPLNPDEGEEMFCLLEVEKSEEEEGGENDLMQMVGKLVMAMLVKYWIYICSGMFFFVSFEGRIVMYKIIYMMLFLFCVALYQVSSFKYPKRMRKVNIQSRSLLFCQIVL